MIRCSHCQDLHETAARVRECAVATTTVRRETRSARPAEPSFRAPTTKQMSFLADLAAKKLEDSDDYLARAAREWDRAQVSEEIDRLKALPNAHQAPTADAPEGIHCLEGADEMTVYKVQVAHHGSGKKYVKELTEDGWTYVGRKPLRDLSDATVMTREQAKRYGALYGMCGVCGATLTDEDSIARGIGPVCAQKF